MKNFAPTFIAYISIWIVVIGYYGYIVIHSHNLKNKLESLGK